jgi:arylsulfatase A-like enzyme
MASRLPNVVLILCDDLGYGDIEPYGGSIPTPALNRMAREGLTATDYYCPANICTPSRAGILTGRYPVRTGLGYEVIFPDEDRALPLTEPTIAAALKPDYVSGYFGKWHLGHFGSSWLPTNYGFDTFAGIPYSHDMLPLEFYVTDTATGAVTASPVEFPALQQQFYEHAERFIERHSDRPFFVELALSAPHLPEYPFGEFKGSSAAGPYGDVVREIDAITGRLLDKLTSLAIEQDTLVIFTSDNGPWYEGSTGPLRDRKGGAGYDGGYRVPFIVWAPGMVPPGSTTDAIICGIDLLPTFCELAGRDLPAVVEFDGCDISPVLTAGAASPHEEILLFNNEDVVAVRTQAWKYIDRSYYRALTVSFERDGFRQLYDMTRDAAESYSVAETYPDVTEDMQTRLRRARERYAPFKRGVPQYFEQMRRQGRFRRQD